jgi:hypothetical protein
VCRVSIGLSWRNLRSWGRGRRARLTNSPHVALRGSQKPRVLTRPSFVSEAAGWEAIDLAESVGLHLDPWQKLAVRVILAERADGKYAASQVGFLVARQNGKGGILEAVALHGLFLVGDPLTLWTAHQTKTSLEAHQRVKGWIEGSADLSRKVKAINSAHGEEGVTLHNGCRLRFIARSKQSGRGFSPQRIILDEAQELAATAAEALLPSLRAQPNKQSIYCGTVPGPEANHPDAWTRVRDRGRIGGADAGRLAWMEWTPKGSDHPVSASTIDLGSPRVWADSNPAIGFRVDPAQIADERDELGDEAAARELFSIWPSSVAGEGIFGNAPWAKCVVGDCEPPDRGLVLGVAVSIDRKWASLGSAVVDGDRVLVAAVDRRPRSEWVVSEVERIQRERACPVVIDGKGPGSWLIEPLREAGVSLVVMDTDDICDASADMDNAVKAGRLAHMDHPDLNFAHSAAAWRAVGERQAIGRKVSSGDVSMLEAVTLAAWQAARSYDVLDSIH